MYIESDHFKTLEELIDTIKMWVKNEEEFYDRWFGLNEMNILVKEIERLNKCIDEALEIIIKDWNNKCTIPIHSVVDTGGDIRIKLYYQLFLKGVDKE